MKKFIDAEIQMIAALNGISNEAAEIVIKKRNMKEVDVMEGYLLRNKENGTYSIEEDYTYLVHDCTREKAEKQSHSLTVAEAIVAENPELEIIEM